MIGSLNAIPFERILGPFRSSSRRQRRTMSDRRVENVRCSSRAVAKAFAPSVAQSLRVPQVSRSGCDIGRVSVCAWPMHQYMFVEGAPLPLVARMMTYTVSFIRCVTKYSFDITALSCSNEWYTCSSRHINMFSICEEHNSSLFSSRSFCGFAERTKTFDQTGEGRTTHRIAFR